jgi:hypothetical protein
VSLRRLRFDAGALFSAQWFRKVIFRMKNSLFNRNSSNQRSSFTNYQTPLIPINWIFSILGASWMRGFAGVLARNSTPSSQPMWISVRMEFVRILPGSSSLRHLFSAPDATDSSYPQNTNTKGETILLNSSRSFARPVPVDVTVRARRRLYPSVLVVC